jgi:hypothetical protein
MSSFTGTSIPPGWLYSAAKDGYQGPNGEFISKFDIMIEGSFVKAYAKIYGATGGGATSVSNHMALPPGATSVSNHMALPPGAPGASNHIALPPGAPGANGPAGPYIKHSHGHIAPTSPNDGDLWTDTVSGKLYVYTTHNGWTDTDYPIVNTPATTNIPKGWLGGSGGGNLSIATGKSSAFHESLTNVIQIETKVGRVGINTETGDITIPPGIGRDEAIREFWFGFQKVFKPLNKNKYEIEIEGLKRDYARLETYYKDKLVNLEKDATKPIIEKIRKKYNGEKFIMVKPEDLIKFIEEV